jgi:hypothetical protein
MLAGFAIDAVDLMTFGPIGLWSGLVLGGAVGYWLAPEIGFNGRARWMCALLAGFYCTMPMTGFMPAATLLAGLWSALVGSDDETENRQPLPGKGDHADHADHAEHTVIDAEYRSEWEEPEQR